MLQSCPLLQFVIGALQDDCAVLCLLMLSDQMSIGGTVLMLCSACDEDALLMHLQTSSQYMDENLS